MSAKVAERFSDLPRFLSTIARTGEALGEVADVGRAAGLTRLRAHHEILKPGRRSSSPHRHSTRDEIVVVLRGRPSAWIEGELLQLEPGSALSLAAGGEARHAIVNASDEDAELFVVSNEDGTDEVVY